MSKQDEAIRRAAEELETELGDGNESGGIINSLTKSIENLTSLFKAKKLPKDLVDDDETDDPDYDADDAEDEDSEDLDKTAKKAGIERGKDEKRNMGGDVEDIDDVPPEPKSKRAVKGPGAKGKATIDKSGRGDDEDAESIHKAITQEDFYADLLENESFEEVVEASDALAHMTDVLGKSLANVHGDIVDINEKVAAIGQAVMVMMKSQQAILKNLEEWASQPARSTSPGVHVNFGGRKPATGGAITKSQLQGGLKKAVEDGKLEPRWLSLLDTRQAEDIVQMLPADVRQAYLS